MLETERRTAISTSQLGLYSDRVDRYSRSRYSFIARKIAIGVMVVVAAILVGIFLYDFASASSMNGKLSQETKHVYILQNALKKPTSFTKKFADTTVPADANRTGSHYVQDRSDNESQGNPFLYDETDDRRPSDGEFRSRNSSNFEPRERVLKSVEDDVDGAAESKQLFDNHALVYRVRQRHRFPDAIDDESSEENRPAPFHWELKTPQPTAFKRPRYPQLTQYRYPHASRSIQDIVKYLTNDADLPNRGIKFSGVYVNPKKYDLYPELGETMSNSDRSDEDESFGYPFNEDPFYRYKPKHPADVNLLATSNVRFTPTGLHRYTYDNYGRPYNYYRPTSVEGQYESPTSHSNSYPKKRKPQPFSVMLDIYPITDIAEQNKKATRPKPILPVDDYELRRPMQYGRGPKFYAAPPQPLTAAPGQTATDEEERQQMIFHLNLYPRKKNKMTRHDIIHRSESMAPDDRRQFVDKVWTPLETIAKHLAVERSKVVDDDGTNLAATRYQETVLDGKGETSKFPRANDSTGHGDDLQEGIVGSSNYKSNTDEDYAGAERFEYHAQRVAGSTTESECEDCETTTISIGPETSDANIDDNTKDIDTVEGFEQFSDSVSKTR